MFMIVTLTRRMLDVFAERAILHGEYGRERWRVGEQLAVHRDAEIEAFAQPLGGQCLPRRFGFLSYSRSRMVPRVEVGRFSSIARDVTFLGGAHPADWASTSPIFYQTDPSTPGWAEYRKRTPAFAALPLKDFDARMLPVKIGNDVWIGEQAMLAPGVTIGDGAIVGARALVTRDVPPYAVVVGQPARVMRMRFSDSLVERLQALQWWRYPPEVALALRIQDPERFVGEMEDAIAGGAPLLDIGPPLRPADLLGLGPDPT